MDMPRRRGLDSSVGSGFAPWPRGRGFETQPSTVRAPTGWRNTLVKNMITNKEKMERWRKRCDDDDDDGGGGGGGGGGGAERGKLMIHTNSE
ncbi:hypothetical protein ElyMa_002789500 [Elysia marginata]|uniref:Uncharacterized protein n=1 Tax=Elysia marginata TaxID=1093978 RepID=A0AAV4HRG1_9GAST|nr:hypothetical protein ElyMa_002789500 [Elysia marginata]